MSGIKGMNVAVVRATASKLDAQAAGLDHIISELSVTKKAAVNPHAYGIDQGERTIAPWSIGALTSASAELRAAQAAVDDLVRRLRAEADAQVATSAASGSVSSGRKAGRLTKSTAAVLDPVLAEVAALSAAEMAAWLSAHPEFAEQLADMDPAMIAAWWAGLDKSQRDALIEGAPFVFGNLDGVPYSDRDDANQLYLEQTKADLIALRDEYYAMLGQGNDFAADDMLADNGWSIITLLDSIEAAESIEASLAAGTDERPRTLVQVDLGPHPTAAIAVGDMDTATQITTLVPGMGTTVAGSMESWSGAAENLYHEQWRLNEDYEVERGGLAVVAWIGYDTPVMPWVDPGDVLRSDKAEAGAANLVDFLEGISGTRDWSEGQNLSLVGHSYGTTTAMFAAAETAVENLTMLGSAGADSSIDSVDDLKVNPANIWASEADADGTADWGRVWPSEHQNNPTDSSFGANTFISEDGASDYGEFYGSDGHGATPQTDAALNGSSTQEFGYLDLGSTPLWNTAVTSLGLTGTGLLAIIPKVAGGGGGGGGGGGW